MMTMTMMMMIDDNDDNDDDKNDGDGILLNIHLNTLTIMMTRIIIAKIESIFVQHPSTSPNIPSIVITASHIDVIYFSVI